MFVHVFPLAASKDTVNNNYSRCCCGSLSRHQEEPDRAAAGGAVTAAHQVQTDQVSAEMQLHRLNWWRKNRIKQKGSSSVCCLSFFPVTGQIGARQDRAAGLVQQG